MGTNAAIPPAYAAPQPVQPKSRKKFWIILILSILLAIFLLIVGCVGAIFLGVSKALKSSQVYKMSIDRAQASPCAVSKLGTPITGGTPQGSINESNGSGTTDMTVSVSGPQANGKLHTLASRDNNVWTLTTVTLNVNGTDYDLPADPAPCAQ
jgi:hypothetical protein